eukprot:CAMPEP_0114158646 /NCGR_PEP_ID=MMETSP0043_2-20121206/27339_1 /TAXON_ID=464988 /ORGANISM="Hemiselmis andersenii, Strain CCMP644" /LENGTH=318 /DNA_ID=CAMNT_0001254441 /DNA_START=48 /DNA_END=1000 /DNA_ORIENTATION=-
MQHQSPFSYNPPHHQGQGSINNNDNKQMLSRDLELLFADENIRFDTSLTACLDQQGYADASVLALLQKVSHRCGGRGDVLADSASLSPLLETTRLGNKTLIRRRRPFKSAELPPLGSARGGIQRVQQQEKEMPDGMNFRASGGSSATFAPHHKTAMGKKGDVTEQGLKDKKALKNQRKQQQAEREEANRRKRARDGGPAGAPPPPAKAQKGEAGEAKVREKKPPKSEEERARGQFRHRVNVCCKGNEFEKAMEVVKEMREGGIEPDLQMFTQLVNMAASDGAKHWEGGEVLMKEIRSAGVSMNEGLISAMIKLCSGAG